MKETQVILWGQVELDPQYQQTINTLEPNSTILDYLHATKPKLVFYDLSQIKGTSVRLPIELEEAYKYNYLTYQNLDDDGKLFCAFITDYTYINDKTTAIEFEIDVMTTYQKDYELQESYIDRGHVDRARPNGERVFNTIPENLEVGSNLVVSKEVKQEEKYFSLELVILKSKHPWITNIDQGHYSYTKYKLAHDHIMPYHVALTFKKESLWDSLNNTSSAIFIKGWYYQTDPDTALSLPQYGRYYAGTLSYDFSEVVAVIPIETIPFDWHFERETIESNSNSIIVIESQNVMGLTGNTSSPDIKYPVLVSTISNDNPDGSRHLFSFNKTDIIPNFVLSLTQYDDVELSNETKIYTSPYHIFKLIKNYALTKDIEVQLLPNSSTVNIRINIIPNYDYREYYQIEGYQEANSLLINAGESSLPLTTDLYLEYMKNNKASREAGLLIPIVSTVAGIAATAVGVGALGVPMIVGGITSIGSTIAQDQARQTDLKNSPDSVRASQGSKILNMVTNHDSLRLQVLRIQTEYMFKVASYFYNYGYKIGRTQKPNINSRYWFNYIKLNAVNLKLINSIPSIHLSKIKDNYLRGIKTIHYRGIQLDADIIHDGDYMSRENKEVILL